MGHPLDAPQWSIAIAPKKNVDTDARILITYAVNSFDAVGAAAGIDCGFYAGASPPIDPAPAGPVRWYLLIGTITGGTPPHRTITWADPQLIHESKRWPACIMAVDGMEHTGHAPVAYDPHTGYIAVTNSESVNRADGKYVGERIVFRQSATGAAGTWDAWVPSCNPAKHVGVAGTNSLPLGHDEPFCNQFAPTIAVSTYEIAGSTVGRFASSFYCTLDGTSIGAGDNAVYDAWGYTVKAGLPIDRNSYQTSLTPLGGGVPWRPNNHSEAGLFSYGDYQGLTADDKGNFIAVWIDNRFGSIPTGQPVVWSARFRWTP